MFELLAKLVYFILKPVKMKWFIIVVKRRFSFDPL